MAHDVEFEVRLRANGAGIFSPNLQIRRVPRDFVRHFAQMRKKLCAMREIETVRPRQTEKSTPAA